MASEKQIAANRLNALKAGRKKGAATIEREKMKEYIAQRIADNGEAIVTVLIDKALTGDVPAIKELFDRGFGKPMQQTDVTTMGKAIIGNSIILSSFNATDSE